MRWDEGMVHVAMRTQLRKEGWMLLAGQPPGGTDDELPPLNIVDPALARDRSPDPRRHSSGKLVPDLVALKDSTLLLVEAKVGYCDEDRRKLLEILGPRRPDLMRALRELARARNIQELAKPEALEIVPALAQAAPCADPPPDGFAAIRAQSLFEATFLPPVGQVVA
jgi:hypothetical protein